MRIRDLRSAITKHRKRSTRRPSRRSEYGDAGGFNDGKNTDFWISKRDSVAPRHLAFEAKDKGQVDAFYEAALAAGGKDNGGLT